ncbi:GlxA family transcriptional regulator [Halofilum ochraceum]|uniref:choline metabolism transcriptional regulator GbdR n=1 Tax=Halofilum ochraceum TaxID=1611323 RepID=UPI0008D95107|nr:GlxA family transcriptional regulator [Halofilum ochraceum]
MNSTNDSGKPIRLGFLLTPEYSMIAFASAIEPLRMANRLSGKRLYQWTTYTVDGEAVMASNGLEIRPDAAITEVAGLDTLFVCSGLDVERASDRATLSWLKKLGQQRMNFGALCTGAHVLARAGLLDGYRCTLHWENIASMREAFPRVVVSYELFEIDRDRFTSAGGTAPLDMMLNLITLQIGADTATAISEAFACERIRGRHDRQRIPLQLRLGTSQPKLIETVSIMESNIEEPISLDELARHVGVSRRQLERLFQKHLSCVPTRYYLELRLARARQLLLQTSISIVDVAFACGFVSAPHFSKCYRDYFGIPPREERRLRGARTGEHADASIEDTTEATLPADGAVAFLREAHENPDGEENRGGGIDDAHAIASDRENT